MQKLGQIADITKSLEAQVAIFDGGKLVRIFENGSQLPILVVFRIQGNLLLLKLCIALSLDLLKSLI